MIKNFVHLHTHSHYSLLDGMAKISELVARAKELRMPALAITDHGVMYGAIEFYEKAREAGIKPIIGCEVYLTKNHKEKNDFKSGEKNHHLVLLAKNQEGYRNLLKIVSLGHLEGFYYKPRVDKNILRRYSAGLIALSACNAGEIPRLIEIGKKEKAEKVIKEYQAIFGKDDFYLEIQPHSQSKELNNIIKKLSLTTGASLVATSDIHYVKPEDKEVQDILLCVQSGKKIDDADRISLKEFDLHFKTSEEMRSAFLDVPEACDNTLKIADKCNLTIEIGKLLLPTFPTVKGETAENLLYKLCDEGAKKRYGQNLKNCEDKVRERFEYEAETIKRMGFSSYLLIVQDFVNWAKKNGVVVGPGRGSAAGSLISYLLGITEIDPLKYALLFERFLNPDRISMPDIDVDFADDRRDEVIEYVSKKYGKERVAQIITFGTMAARASIRDVGRVLNYPYELCDRVAKMVPMMTDFNKALKTANDLKDIYQKDPAVRKMIDYARRLEGVARHASRHACGVIIAPEDLTNFAPLQYASNDDKTIIAQYEMKSVEKVGLLKMDFLGLKNLTLLQKTVDIIKYRHKREIDLNDLPLNDQKAFELFQRGETTGFFQFESAGMRRYLKKLRPTVFEDLIAMAALYRPGPLNSGMVDEFIARKHGKRKIIFSHPSMEMALKNTYGVIVYQEQVMQLSKDMAGFTGGEADTLRKGMGKKIAELILKLREDFVKGCVKKGIKKEIAEKAFTDMEKFAEYGFNRSHATCYAMIGYQTAYLKGNYPAEFMAALMTADKNDIERIAIEVEECRQIGIEVLPPSVNKSFGNFTVVDEGQKTLIRFGLRAIKNVGENIVEEIVKERKRGGEYKNVSEFLKRINHKDLNKKSLESLIKAGALKDFGERGLLMANLEKFLQYHKQQAQKGNAVQGLFGEEVDGITLLEAEKIPVDQKLIWEKELLGLFISGHPLDDFKDKLDEFTVSVSKLTLKDDRRSVRVAGVIGKVKKIQTRAGDSMVFAEIEDFKGKAELIIFPRVFQENQEYWIAGLKIVAEGKISTKDESVKILVDKVYEIKDFMKMLTENKVDKEYERKVEKGEFWKEKRNFYANRNKGQQGFSEKKTELTQIDPRELVLLKKQIAKNENKQKEIITKGKIFLFLDKTINFEIIVPRINITLSNSVRGEIPVILKIKNDEKNAEKELRTAFSVKFTNKLRQELFDILSEERVKWEKE